MGGRSSTTDNEMVAYDAAGTGPTVALVHGWSCDRSYWRNQRVLSERFRVVSIDLVGHGESSTGRREWTMTAFGGDVVAVLDDLAVGEAVLVGHSMGGNVCLEAARRPELRELAEARVMSFDRLVSTARLLAAGGDEVTLQRSFGYDVAGVARLTAQRRRISREDEELRFRDRYPTLQPALDRLGGRLHAQLPAVAYTIVERAIVERADSFDLPGPAVARPQRMADALTSIAHDALDPDGSDPSGGPPASGHTEAETAEAEPADAAADDAAVDDGRRAERARDGHGTGAVSRARVRPLVQILVDADLTAASRGAAGAEIAYGPRVGPTVLHAMLCDGAVQIIGLADGRPVVASHTTETIPPAIRAAVIARDGACCADGCTSRYRLQIHHIRPRAHGIDHDMANLATLCWFHHHVVIHGLGYTIDPTTPHQRLRFHRRTPTPTGPDPP